MYTCGPLVGLSPSLKRFRFTNVSVTNVRDVDCVVLRRITALHMAVCPASHGSTLTLLAVSRIRWHIEATRTDTVVYQDSIALHAELCSFRLTHIF
jgi:hypothetical protein